MSSGTQYTVSPMVPGVRPKDDPDYDGLVFVYVFTNVLDPWTQPPVNGNVTLVVANSQGFVPGMTIVIGDGNGGTAGYYEVVDTSVLDRMTVMNFGTEYNQDPGTGFGPDKITTTSLPGPPGGIGPQGPIGPLGPPGPPLNPKGTVATSSALPASGNNLSDLYITLDTGHGWSWNGNNWIDTGPYQGPQGVGVQGPVGPQGNQGVQGPQGAQGNQGPIGNTGATGAQGPIGNTGPTGATGIQGPIGNTGPTGSTGNTGAAGPQGATGPQGPPGGASAYTTLAATFTMPASGSTAIATVASGGASQFNVGGIVYISPIGYLAVTAINAGANQLTLQNLGYTVNQAQGSTAPSGSTLTGVGPAGPQGPTGATGAQGIQGPIGNTGAAGSTGAQGPAGTTGATGPAGAAATVAPGTTTTGAAGTNAAVTNSGTTSAAVFNFTIPQGIQGVQGVQGTTGNTGATGATGSQGPSGATGAQGPMGVNAHTITSAQFTVPPVGSTVVVTVQNASWLVLGQYLEVQTAGGTSVSGTLQVTNISGNNVTLLNPSIPSLALANTSMAGLLGQLSGNATDYVGGDNACHPFAPASTTAAGLLNQLSGNTTDFVDGTNACQNLANAVQPTIWSVRLRSFNAIGNPNFEVGQSDVGNAITAGTATRCADRWFWTKSSGAMIATAQRQNAASVGQGVLVPGTNFTISRNFLRITLTGAQATLAAGDLLWLNSNLEGTVFRELQNDVHSISLLVRSSVAGLSFGVALRDPPTTTQSLTKLCTISSANTWTLISLPNLPLWPSAGAFTSTAGIAAYQLSIALAAGATWMSPANDTWQNGNFVGALGQSNFASSPVNSTFDIGFIQHEPGPVCTTPIDKPFIQNYGEALRYFCKTYDYAVLPGATGVSVGVRMGIPATATGLNNLGNQHPVVMAKVPTVSIYNHSTGALNSVRDIAGADHAISSLAGQSTMSPFYGAVSSGLTAGASGLCYFHYTADTGW